MKQSAKTHPTEPLAKPAWRWTVPDQFAAPRLLELGLAAERAGFDELWTSDPFHPWQDNQGHSGQAWITLAALGQRPQTVPFGTGVTCPTFR